jgi:hypothetical protein
VIYSVSKTSKRTPKNYDGTQVTTHRISDLLPVVLVEIGTVYQDRPDLILAAWPSIVGSTMAPMTQAISFQEGVLVVKVKNSTLHSLLSQQDKPKILAALRNKFPNIDIKNVFFRIG